MFTGALPGLLFIKETEDPIQVDFDIDTLAVRNFDELVQQNLVVLVDFVVAL